MKVRVDYLFLDKAQRVSAKVLPSATPTTTASSARSSSTRQALLSAGG